VVALTSHEREIQVKASRSQAQAVSAGEGLQCQGEEQAQIMLNLDLRCATCNRYAYTDAFNGEYGEPGYTCSSCLKAVNAKTLERMKQAHFDEYLKKG